MRARVLLEREQLLGSESLIMNLRRRFDEILEVGPGQKVAQRDELAVVLVLDVDDAPSVLPASDLLAVHDDALFRSDDSEGDEVLHLGVHAAFVVVVLFVVVGEHAEVVEEEFFFDAFFEGHSLLKGEGVGFCDDGDDVDDIG